MEDFGQYLRQLREDKNLSRPDVRYEARRRWGVKISEDALVLWEGGKTPGIPAVGLLALVRLYGADPNDVFERLFNAVAGEGDGPAPPQDDPPAGTKPDAARPRRRRGAR
jgi:hypothetical protein